MNTVVIEGAVAKRSVTVTEALVLRTLLVSGCVAVAGAAALVSEPSLLLRADPELAFLFRGMAMIKGAILVGAVALLLASHQARAGGTPYIFTGPGLASCRLSRLDSNVKQRKTRLLCAND